MTIPELLAFLAAIRTRPMRIRAGGAQLRGWLDETFPGIAVLRAVADRIGAPLRERALIEFSISGIAIEHDEKLEPMAFELDYPKEQVRCRA